MFSLEILARLASEMLPADHAAGVDLVVERVAADALDVAELAGDRHPARRRAWHLAEGEDADAARAVVELERVVGVAAPGDTGVDLRDGAGQTQGLSIVRGRVRQHR